ncbi:pantoate--beta-alanine ligase [Gemmobacter fulvus]|uniref:Pantothenate synthetase n=1 Tax=Gemmobacter fulvus TaxID=2840474 RepID=A0A975PB91_9RHOB|nr:pantoate--beta-alanine ligase [Gemmobacter fulvus]MBT9244703.1 pantoate--beta-alanine ligase [Gemmobacter fulvus]MDQ1848767.1 pantoate--beta-alanine ligase [Gemmobacter fulvus]QWK91946.1 pantoate--beta-alanine ligase [Gemmobacter fulvus]
MMQILRTVAELRTRVRGWKADGKQVGVVPTMGALHEGHMSLVRAAQRGCDRVIVTIFVNPMQFNNPDDLTKYPRTEDSDAALLAREGVDIIFAPTPDEVYPKSFATSITVAGISEPLEGTMRPGHFEGVATVVAKLFGMTQADRAYFGQKDWQQLQVVKRMVADLNIPIEVVGCDTIREQDGLAMSSRNVRLDPLSRAQAPALHRILTRAATAIRDSGDVATVLETARADLRAAGFTEVEYLDLRSAALLEPMARLDAPARLLVAAWIGGVRLIDNIPV